MDIVENPWTPRKRTFHLIELVNLLCITCGCLFYKAEVKEFNSLLNAVSHLHKGLSAYKPFVELLQSLSGTLPLRYIMPHVHLNFSY